MIGLIQGLGPYVSRLATTYNSTALVSSFNYNFDNNKGVLNQVLFPSIESGFLLDLCSFIGENQNEVINFVGPQSAAAHILSSAWSQ